MDLDKATKLGKVATAHAQWAWCGGMLTICGVRLFEGGDDYIIGYKSGPTKDGGGHVDTLEIDKYVPDLRDDATLGCLLSLVRRKYQSPNLYVEYDEADGWPEGCAMWRVQLGVQTLGTGKTEAEALVDAFAGNS